ncbi:MAG: hypothetical protein LWX56_11705 [Ignavibacteria bacterium]|nr:hypothetical protein [Ignavibacteria bacterium]
MKLTLNSNTVRTYSYYITIFFIALVYFGTQCKPEYNWDLLPYTGAVLAFDGLNDSLMMERSYELAKKELPAVTYQNLIHGEYRDRIAHSPALFHERVKIATTRPLYVTIQFILAHIGFSIIQAGIVISGASCVAIFLLLFYWLYENYRPLPALALTIFIAWFFHLRELAQLSTPDGLNGLFVLLFCYYLLKRNESAIYGTMLAGILTRYESALVFIIVFISFIIANRKSAPVGKEMLWRFIFSVFSGIAMVSIFSGMYPFDMVKEHLFLGSFSGGPLVSGESYTRLMFSLLAAGLGSIYLYKWYIPLAFMQIYIRKVVPGSKSEFFIAEGIWLALGIRFILFPNAEARFYIIPLIAITMVLLHALKDKFTRLRK